MSSALLTEGELVDGKYKILGSLGRGAWGHVYEGINERIGRTVAIKVMHTEVAARGDMRERFEREARAATKIESEHVVHVFDMGFVPDGRPYIVMELLRGEDLAKRIDRDGRMDVDRVAIIGVQALRGLAEAHASGILHRDIKPDNIVLVRTKSGGETVKIVDFGISKLVMAGALPSDQTQTAQVLGSPVYMSPEQCRGAKNMDHRSDIYSLGVALYEAVTGELPFEADSFNELMFKIALEDAPNPRAFVPDLDVEFSAILMNALAREPHDRYQSAEEFEGALLVWGESRGLMSDDWRRLSSSISRKVASTNPTAFARTLPVSGIPTAIEAATLDSRRPEMLRHSVAGSIQALVSTHATPPPPAARRRTAVYAALGAAALFLAVGTGVALKMRGADAPARAAARAVEAQPPVTLAADPAPLAATPPTVAASPAAPASPHVETDAPAPKAAAATSPAARTLRREHGKASRGAVRAAAQSDAGVRGDASAGPTTVIDGRTIQTEL